MRLVSWHRLGHGYYVVQGAEVQDPRLGLHAQPVIVQRLLIKRVKTKKAKPSG